MNNDRMPLELLPTFGFFGDHETNCLVVDTEATADCIEIFMNKPGGEFLNLGRIDLFDAGGHLLSREEICARVEMSTVYNDRAPEVVNQAFIEGTMLHSKKEIRPGLKIHLKTPTFLKRIEVHNRRDQWAKRSFGLQMNLRLKDVLQFSYGSCSEQRRQAALVTVGETLRSSGIDDISVDPSSGKLDYEGAPDPQNHDAALGRVKRACLDAYRAGPDTWGSPELLLSLVDFTNPAYLPSAVDFEILAEYALHLMGKSLSIETHHLAVFSSLLRSSERIGTFLRAVNSSYNMKHDQKRTFIMSKHTLNASRLLELAEPFMSLLSEVFGILERTGRRGVLCYGSLLGAVRTGGVIPHDDDIDVLYIDDSTDRAMALQRSEEVVADFKKLGFQSWRPTGSLNFNVNKGNLTIDLFPCWFEADKVFLMMERFQIRSIAKDILVPLGSANLCGRTFPAPGKPEEFLAERYGPTWKIPNAFYEWPWKIVE